MNLTVIRAPGFQSDRPLGSTFPFPRAYRRHHHQRMSPSPNLGDRTPLLPPSTAPDSRISGPYSAGGDARPAPVQRPRVSPRKGLFHQIQAIGIILLALLIVMTATLLTSNILPKSATVFTHVPLPGLKNPNILRYLGGMGPYIGDEYTPPPCRVTQLHLLSRHGERYPTTHMARSIARFARNISRHTFHGDLQVLNSWRLEDWIYDPQRQLEQETVTGPAAGSLSMFKLGTELRSLYPGLWNFTSDRDWGSGGDGSSRRRRLKVWSSQSERVIDSAKYFSSGFFGHQDPEIQFIPETQDRWANTLTPSRSCPVFFNPNSHSHGEAYGDYKSRGDLAMETFQKTFLPKITRRLQKSSNSYMLTGIPPSFREQGG